MADFYPKQLVGVADGTSVPAKQADGREVGGGKRSYQYSKVTGTAWAVNDRLYLGKKAASEKVVAININTGTSLGSSNLDIGTVAAPDKYVDGVGTTVTNAWVSLGPKAATLGADIPEDEELWATVKGATIVAGTELTIEIVTSGI